MKRLLSWIITCAMASHGLSQLNNAIFNGTQHFLFREHRLSPKDSMMDLTRRKPGFGTQVLSYLKNDEFNEFHNPGKTLIGSQIGIGFKQYLERPNAYVYIGGLLNYPYGGDNIQAYPLIQFTKSTKHSALVVGSLHGTTRHRLFEALYAYDYALTQPMEYGLQYLGRKRGLSWDIWLDWRQMAERKSSQQEIISFGLNSSIALNKASSRHRWSIPISSLLFHKGGEFLKVMQPVQNQWNASIGLRGDLFQNRFRVESVFMGSMDFSPKLLHRFKDGHAWLTNIRWNMNLHHTLALSHYYAEEFYAPLGPNLYQSEQIGFPNRESRFRNFLHLRYQYNHTLVPKKASLDFRIEPIYHLESQKVAFSTGVYLKYVIGREIY